MKHIRIILLLLCISLAAQAQQPSAAKKAKNVIYYNSNWQRISNSKQATYYRVLTVDKRGQKMFYDYYIGGQLRAEKHYITLNMQDDKLTVLTGIARTFYKSGRVESIMTYRNGKAHGRAVSFYPDGSVGMKMNYANGVLHGNCYSYLENGRLEYSSVWQNGSKVKEQCGGRDKNIDWKKNIDAFITENRKDEPRIMAQSKAIATGKKAINKPRKQQPIKPLATNKETENQEPLAVEPTEVTEIQVVDNNKKVQNVKYPTNKLIKAPKTQGNAPQAITFEYIYTLLAGGHNRTNDISYFDQEGARHGLTLAQVIKGHGSQKELAYNYNMHYDEETNKDVVTGENPRQLGFFGVGVGKRFTTEQVNIYTWSEDEMLSIAKAAIAKGFVVLGGGDYLSTDGNFILEDPEHNKAGDDMAIILSFTHLDDAYAGLYHIKATTK
ncbi:toxin-antitoxin system YwqK family antitoxin [Prevotella ihumii]|uniref:toxin-antitoxin system YwqK family antitoxin n=1 Tax=Prevotella ihumii TaxID=1917878 RepID=UPI000981D27A|nr:hypothetical protein [Prevotella ihumii]